MATGEDKLPMLEILDDIDAVPEQDLTQDHYPSQTPFFPAAVLMSAPLAHHTPHAHMVYSILSSAPPRCELNGATFD